jgi:hypothetical protein
MTETQTPTTRAGAKRQEEEWMATLRRQEELLRALPDHDLNTLVATTVFDNPELAAVPFCTDWDGMGRIVEYMREHGYTLLFSSFEPSHLDWINNLPDRLKRGDHYLPADASVVDIRHRLPLPQTWPNLRVKAETLPRAAAIAAVLAAQIEKGIVAPPLPQPEEHTPKTDWSEERRRQKSEQMKAYWQRKRAAHAGAATTAQPPAEE